MVKHSKALKDDAIERLSRRKRRMKLPRFEFPKIETGMRFQLGRIVFGLLILFVLPSITYGVEHTMPSVDVSFQCTNYNGTLEECERELIPWESARRIYTSLLPIFYLLAVFYIISGLFSFRLW